MRSETNQTCCRRIAGLRVLAVLLFTGLPAWLPLWGQMPPSWTAAIEPFQIGDNLYYVGSEDLAAYLIATSEGHILIDVPMEENVDLVRGNIVELGFDPADIEIQLASHGHFDHTGGLASMQAVTGARLLLSSADAALIANGGKGDFFFGDRLAYPPAAPDGTLEHLDEVTLGEVTLTAHLTPGHTRGCTSWSGTTTIEGVAYEWVSICSLTALEGYQLVGPDASYPGIARDFCASVAHLRSLEPDIFLASHGQFIDLPAKAKALRSGRADAFVDPEGYSAYLDRSLRNIEKTLGEQGQPGGCRAVLEP